MGTKCVLLQMGNFLFNLILFGITQQIAGSVLEITVIKPKVNDSCGINTGGPLVQQLTRTISYAGGLFWDDEGTKIAYVDRYGSAFGRYTPDNGFFNYWPLQEANEYTGVIPVKNATDLRFVVGKDREIELIYSTGEGANQTANVVPLLTITNDTREHVRIIRTDRNGNGWFATGSPTGDNIGKVYRSSNLSEAVVLVDGLQTGTGMAWTSNDEYFYVADGPAGIIYRYNFELSTGNLSNRIVAFNKTDYPELGGHPSDIAVDLDGYLWIGMFRGGSVIQYDPQNKTILWQIPIPARDIVSLEFGNHDKKTLFVGTAKYYLECPKVSPGSGAIYSISGLGVTGPTDNTYLLPDQYVFMT